MTLKDQIIADSSLFLNTAEFADNITYNGAEITGIMEIGAAMEDGNIYTDEGRSDRAILSISVEDVANPQSQDQVIHKEKTWEVVKIISSDSAMHQLALISDERAVWR